MTASASAGSAEELAPHPYLDHPGPIAFAHRGGASEAPENSLAAFAAAVALGYRYLETDVHVTSDGVLVAFHDDRLDRVTDARGLVAESMWSDLAQARIAGREPIPRFEELLATWPTARINVDPKHDAAVRPLLDLIGRLGAADRVCIGSFVAHRVRAARDRFGVAGCTALTRGEAARLWVRSRFVGGPRGGPRGGPVQPRSSDAERGGRCLQVPIASGPLVRVDTRFVDRAHLEGTPIHVWTVDEEPEMDRLLDLGVDGLMSDEPARLRAVLERRGAWVDAVPTPPGTIDR